MVSHHAHPPGRARAAEGHGTAVRGQLDGVRLAATAVLRDAQHAHAATGRRARFFFRRVPGLFPLLMRRGIGYVYYPHVHTHVAIGR